MICKTSGFQLLTAALLSALLGEGDREELDDKKRKGSLKVTWQNQPRKVLQSSLLDAAGMKLERESP